MTSSTSRLHLANEPSCLIELLVIQPDIFSIILRNLYTDTRKALRLSCHAFCSLCDQTAKSIHLQIKTSQLPCSRDLSLPYPDVRSFSLAICQHTQSLSASQGNIALHNIMQTSPRFLAALTSLKIALIYTPPYRPIQGHHPPWGLSALTALSGLLAACSQLTDLMLGSEDGSSLALQFPPGSFPSALNQINQIISRPLTRDTFRSRLVDSHLVHLTLDSSCGMFESKQQQTRSPCFEDICCRASLLTALSLLHVPLELVQVSEVCALSKLTNLRNLVLVDTEPIKFTAPEVPIWSALSALSSLHRLQIYKMTSYVEGVTGLDIPDSWTQLSLLRDLSLSCLSIRGTHILSRLPSLTSLSLRDIQHDDPLMFLRRLTNLSRAELTFLTSLQQQQPLAPIQPDPDSDDLDMEPGPPPNHPHPSLAPNHQAATISTCLAPSTINTTPQPPPLCPLEFLTLENPPSHLHTLLPQLTLLTYLRLKCVGPHPTPDYQLHPTPLPVPLFHLPLLRTLHLTNIKLTTQHLATLTFMSHLETLHLTYDPFHVPTVIHAPVVWPSLKNLNIHINTPLIPMSYLTATRSSAGDNLLTSFIAPQLEALRVTGREGDIQPSTLDHLISVHPHLDPTQFIKQLTVRFDEESLLRVAQTRPPLFDVLILNCQLINRSGGEHAFIAAGSRLRSFRSCEVQVVEPVVLQHLVAHCHHLRVLKFSGFHIPADALHSLLPSCRHLVSLHVNWAAHLNDQVAIQLAVCCSKLESLYLSNSNRLTGAGVGALSRLTRLRKLELEGFPQVDMDALLALLAFQPPLLETVSVKSCGSDLVDFKLFERLGDMGVEVSAEVVIQSAVQRWLHGW